MKECGEGELKVELWFSFNCNYPCKVPQILIDPTSEAQLMQLSVIW